MKHHELRAVTISFGVVTGAPDRDLMILFNRALLGVPGVRPLMLETKLSPAEVIRPKARRVRR
jgi:hypothetical protein